MKQENFTGKIVLYCVRNKVVLGRACSYDFLSRQYRLMQLNGFGQVVKRKPEDIISFEKIETKYKKYMEVKNDG